MFNYSKHIIFFLKIFTILGLVYLPYFLFNGKLFIGGDDSRLFYAFPWEWLTNIAFYSWFHFSAVGVNNPNQFILPFLSLWSIISLLIKSRVILDYLSFSIPLILGFIFFQKLLREFIEDTRGEYDLVLYTGALIYILSPNIYANTLAIFLYSAWLIGLLPIFTYYFIKYLKTGSFIYVFINIAWCVALSFSVSAIPWLLGFFIPLLLSLCILFSFFSKEKIIIFIKRCIVFVGVFVLSQAFWVYSFIMNILLSEKNSFLGHALSQQSSDTFRNTVLTTASGNIIYPILNLFHRQITIDYKTPLQDIFLSFYDKTIFIDIIYIIVLSFALFFFKKVFSLNEKKYYLIFFVAFLLSLFFFTVNIGPLINIFLFMGHIPGFVMFKNFYDKFALGYTFLYAIILTLSLVVVHRKLKKLRVLMPIVVCLVILINLIPIKQVINKPLWTTKNIYTTISIPQEYINFISQVKDTVPNTANILSLPFNIAGYTIIKEEGSNNIFAGRSPIQLFTGINDFSGNLSFFQSDTDRFITDIEQRNYKDLNNFLVTHNIGYIFVTNNIPQEVKLSYLFDKNVLPYQDQRFLQSITGEKIIKSTNGNYILYKTKYPTSLFNSQNLTYEKINSVTYRLYLKNIKSSQKLDFFDSFSGGWKLYSEIYTSSSYNEFAYLWRKDIFVDSHTVLNGYGNQWIIDPAVIKKNFPQQYYRINPDGSVDMKLTLYFKPQENFYIGTIISVLTILLSLGYVIYYKGIKHEKKN